MSIKDRQNLIIGLLILAFVLIGYLFFVSKGTSTGDISDDQNGGIGIDRKPYEPVNEDDTKEPTNNGTDQNPGSGEENNPPDLPSDY